MLMTILGIMMLIAVVSVAIYIADEISEYLANDNVYDVNHETAFNDEPLVMF